MGIYADREGVIALRLEDRTTGSEGYGVDPTAAADPYGTGAIGVIDPSATMSSDSFTDAIYVEEATLEANRTSLARRGPSAYEHGFMPVAGPEEISFTCRFELTPQSLTDTPVIGDIPTSLDAGLRMGGMIPGTPSAGANNDTISYGVKSNPQDSVTAYIYQTNADDDAGWIHKAHGLRGGFTLDVTAEERVFFAPDAVGSTHSREPHTSSRATLGLPTYDFSTAPLVGGGMECLIKAITADETYPDAGRVVSFNLTRGGGQIQRGVCGQKAAVLPGEELSATLVLECTDNTDFDPYQYQGQDDDSLALPDALLVQIGTSGFSFNASGVPQASSGDYILMRGYFYVTAVSMGNDAGALTWSLTLQGAYAPGTLAGDTPSDNNFEVIFGTYSP